MTKKTFTFTYTATCAFTAKSLAEADQKLQAYLENFYDTGLQYPDSWELTESEEVEENAT